MLNYSAALAYSSYSSAAAMICASQSPMPIPVRDDTWVDVHEFETRLEVAYRSVSEILIKLADVDGHTPH